MGFESAILISISDASWAGETVDEGKSVKKHMSQRASMVVLADPTLKTSHEGYFYPLQYSSNIIQRLCRSTMQAKTQALQCCVEEGWKIRAALSEIKGFPHDKNWETTSSKATEHLWLTDCKSLHDHLTTPVMGKVSDKRLGIDLLSMRQELWTVDNQEVDALDKDVNRTHIRWIDTSTMIVDCLTKSMKPDDLVNALDSGKLSLTPSAISVARKLQKQHSRRSTETTSTLEHED